MSTKPNRTDRMNPAELEEGGWYRTIAVTGVATTHELWIDDSGERGIYIVAPAGGPLAAIARWATTEHEFPAWDLVDHTVGRGERQFELQCAAEDYVVEQARLEVRTEMGL